MLEKNKAIIREFFAMQNNMAPVRDIRRLFAESYTITDLAELDVKSKKTTDIEKRITNFRQLAPGYHVSIKELIAEENQVFVWFSVHTKADKLLLHAMVLFSLDQEHKITKVIEIVKK